MLTTTSTIPRLRNEHYHIAPILGDFASPLLPEQPKPLHHFQDYTLV